MSKAKDDAQYTLTVNSDDKDSCRCGKCEQIILSSSCDRIGVSSAPIDYLKFEAQVKVAVWANCALCGEELGEGYGDIIIAFVPRDW